jgi:hypothetical protein
VPLLFETIRAWTVNFRLQVVNVECVKTVDRVYINMCIYNSVPCHSITQSDSLFSHTNLTLEFKISCQLTLRKTCEFSGKGCAEYWRETVAGMYVMSVSICNK